MEIGLVHLSDLGLSYVSLISLLGLSQVSLSFLLGLSIVSLRSLSGITPIFLLGLLAALSFSSLSLPCRTDRGRLKYFHMPHLQ